MNDASGVLKHQVAWVTGAGSGIGLAAAHALVALGATVVLSGRRADLLAAARTELAVDADRVLELPLDVSDADAVAQAATAITARFGRIDILVNSAGINIPNRSWSAVTPPDFARVVGINLNGAMASCHAVLPTMRHQGSGLIINVSSWAGRFDTQLTGAAYNASKHALVALSATINMEEGRHGIRSCALCPGEVATPILKLRPKPPSDADIARMLKADDVGDIIAFLATLPAHVCVNELVVSPTWNRIYLGIAELDAPR